MKVTRTSMFSGTKNTMELPGTEAEWIFANFAHDHGATWKEIFPHLTLDQREFLISGMTPDEWERMCGVEGSGHILDENETSVEELNENV